MDKGQSWRYKNKARRRIIKKRTKMEEKEHGNRFVKIDVDDIMEELIQKIINEHGVESDEVRYIGKIKKLVFELPTLDDSLCNEVMPATSGGDSCGSTGGGCLCGLDKGHRGFHECKRCGEKWDNQDD